MTSINAIPSISPLVPITPTTPTIPDTALEIENQDILDAQVRKRIENAERRTLLTELAGEEAEKNTEPDKQIREDSFEQVRAFPEFDEITEFVETMEVSGGKERVLSLKVIREEIKLDPDQAAQAQGNLNPTRIFDLLRD